MKKRKGSKKNRVCAIILAAALVITLAVPSSVITAGAESAKDDSLQVSAYSEIVSDDTDGTNTDSGDDSSTDGTQSDSGTTDEDSGTTDEDSGTTDGSSGTTDGSSDTGNRDDASDDTDLSDGDNTEPEEEAFAFDSDSEAAGGSITLSASDTTDTTIALEGVDTDAYTYAVVSANEDVAAAVLAEDCRSVTISPASCGKTTITMTRLLNDEEETALTLTVLVQEEIDISGDFVTLTGTKTYDGTADITLTAELDTENAPICDALEDVDLSALTLSIPATADSVYVQKGGSAAIDWESILADGAEETVTLVGTTEDGTGIDLLEYYLLKDGDTAVEELSSSSVDDAVTILAEDALSYDEFYELVTFSSVDYAAVTDTGSGILVVARLFKDVRHTVAVKSGVRYNTVVLSDDGDGTYTFTLSVLKQKDTTVTYTGTGFSVIYDTAGPDVTIEDDDLAVLATSATDTDSLAGLAVEQQLWYSASMLEAEEPEITYRVTDDYSGVSKIYYAWMHVTAGAGASSVLEAISSQLGSPYTGDAWVSVNVKNSGKYSVYVPSEDETLVLVVYATDQYGNQTYAVSNGVVIDVTEPEAELTITGSVNEDETLYGMEEDGTVSIPFTASVTDPLVNSTASGIGSVSVTAVYWPADEERSDTNTASVTVDYVADGAVLDEDAVSVTDATEETSSGYEIDGSVTIPNCDEDQSVQITLTATDLFDNEITVPEEDEIATLTADFTKLQLAASFDGTDEETTEETSCYRERVLTITVSGGSDYDEADLLVNIGTNGDEAVDYSLSDLIDGALTDVTVSGPEETEDGAYVYTVTFGGENLDIDFEVSSVALTDLAGNAADGSPVNLDEAFTIDTIAASFAVEWLAAVSEDADSPLYTNEDVQAELTIKESNFDEAGVYVTVNSTAYTLKSILEGDVDGITAEAVNGETEEEETENDTYTYSLSFEEDGSYAVSLSCTDEAGNETAYDGLTEVYFVIDTNPLDVTFGYDGEETPAIVYFNADTYAALEVKVGITDTEAAEDSGGVSGLAEAKYKWINTAHVDIDDGDALLAAIEADDSEWTTLNDGDTVTNLEDVSNSQLMLIVYAVDQAGNAKYYTSEGLLLDVDAPEVEVTVSNAELSDAAADTYSTDSNELSYEVTVYDPEDNTSGVAPSGVESLTVTVVRTYYDTDSGEETSEKTIITCDAADLDTVEEDGVTKHVYSGTADVSVSCKIYITAEASDTAGNLTESSESTSRTDSWTGIVDHVDPVIDLTGDTAKDGSGVYGDTYSLTLTIEERCYSEDDIVISITVGETLYEISLRELLDDEEQIYANLGISADYADGSDQPAGADNLNDEYTVSYTIEFTGTDAEGNGLDYTYETGSISMADILDNDVAYTFEQDETFKFSVDKKDPIIDIAYYYYDADDKAISIKDGSYQNQKIKAKITVTEANFDPENTRITKDGTLSDGSGTDDASISGSAWTAEDDDTYTAEVTFGKDADYSFIIAAEDLAGNTANDQSPEFTVDLTDPVIAVSYTANDGSVAVNENGSRVYEQGTITAKITITEYNFCGDSFADGQMTLTYSAVNSSEEGVSTKNYANAVISTTAWKEKSNGVYQAELTFEKDANYTLSLDYTDLSGRSDSYGTAKFTVDGTDPTGNISINSNNKNGTSWFKKLTYVFFTNNKSSNKVTIEVNSSDETAGVDTVEYFIDDDADIASANSYETLTAEELEGKKWTTYKNSFSLKKKNMKAFVYARITDSAGNITYINAKSGVIIDNAKANDVSVKIKTEKSKGNFYNTAVTYSVTVKDQSKNDSYSGIASVKAEIFSDGEKVDSWVKKVDSDKIVKSRTYSKYKGKKLTIKKKYASNNVRIKITVTDKAGNTYTQSKRLKMDVTDPGIDVSYNTTDSTNYYNEARTATITIDDINPDWSDTEVVLHSDDGTTDITQSVIKNGGTYTIGKDGDNYYISVTTTDKAGNTASYTDDDIFTVDRTDPVVEVTFDNNDAKNGKYYNASRTATVKITEHNFDSSEFEETVTAKQSGRNVSVGSFSSWTTSGDVHTASVTFSEDADYSIDLSFTDLAGNEAKIDTIDDFTIDTTAPAVTWINAADGTTLKGGSIFTEEVNPGVEINDVNIKAGDITVTIVGYKDINEEKTLTDSTVSGNTITFLAGSIDTEDEDRDDIYTLTVTAQDLAGNSVVVDNAQIRFSVNRFGSTFYIADGSQTDAVIESGLMTEADTIEIHEVNVNGLESYSVLCVQGDETVELTEGQDYEQTSLKKNSKYQEKEYVYTISADYFTQEGEYSFYVRSLDKGSNQSQSNKVDFTYDITPPEIDPGISLVSGETYQESEYTFDVTVADTCSNVVYLKLIVGDEEIETYEVNAMSDTVSVTIPGTDGKETVQLIAVDEAGNSTELLEDYTYTKILVTDNPLQIYRTVIIIAAIVVIAVIIFLLWLFLFIKRRRRDDDDDLEAAG